MTPAPNANPMVNPVTKMKDVISFITKNIVNGANPFDNASNQPDSLINCINIISGKITADNCKTAITAVFNPCKPIAVHVVSSTSDEEIKPYCAGSDPPDQTRLIKKADTSANPTRIPEINHQFTPTLEATADSINKLCEKDNIIAKINTSFTVKSNDTIAPIPAYKSSAFPKTSGIAASPGKPITFIKGVKRSIIHGKTGVYRKIVTKIVTGKTIFPNVHETETPCFNPLNIMPFTYFAFFLGTFFPSYRRSARFILRRTIITTIAITINVTENNCACRIGPKYRLSVRNPSIKKRPIEYRIT